MTISARPQLKLVLPLLFSSVLLNGCDNASKSSGAAASAPAIIASCKTGENDSHAPKTLTALHVQLPWFANGEHSYVYLGKDRSIFKRHGFDVTITGGRGSEVAARALAGGAADVAIIGGDALVLIAAQGGNIVSIGAIFKETPVSIYSIANRGITFDSNLSPEDNLKKLYGKRVGLMPGSNTYLQFEGLIASMNIDRKKIDAVNVVPTLAPQWILNGKDVANCKAAGDDCLDALVHYTEFEPLRVRVVYPNVKINEIRLKDLGVRIYGMTLAVKKDQFSSDQTREIRAAVRDSFMCALKDPNASIAALVANNQGMDFAVPGSPENRFARRQLDEMTSMACGNDKTCSGFLKQDESYWGTTIATLVHYGLIPKPIPAKSIMINDSQ